MIAAHAHTGSTERAKIKREREKEEIALRAPRAVCSNFALQGNPLCSERVNLFLQRAQSTQLAAMTSCNAKFSPLQHTPT
jgi:hypothetical protein